MSNFFTLRADDHADINARGLPTEADAALAHGAQSICSSFLVAPPGLALIAIQQLREPRLRRRIGLRVARTRGQPTQL